MESSKATWGLNGGGRLARRILAANSLSDEKQRIDITQVNEPYMSVEEFAGELADDPIHSRFPGTVKVLDRDLLEIDNKRVKYSQERDPERAWKENHFGVIEATGGFTKRVEAARHLTGDRVRHVLITAPSIDADCTLMYGINHDQGVFSKDTRIVSQGSCTTGSVLPVAQPLVGKFGVEALNILTVHAATGGDVRDLISRLKQRKFLAKLGESLDELPARQLDLLDEAEDLKPDVADTGITAIDHINSYTTGAGISVEQMLPVLKGKLQTGSLRVPTYSGSLSILDFHLGGDVLGEHGVNGLIDEVRKTLTEAAEKYPPGLLRVVDTLPSTALLSEFTENAVVPLDGIQHLGGGVVRVKSGYENEVAAARSNLRTARYMQDFAFGS